MAIPAKSSGWNTKDLSKRGPYQKHLEHYSLSVKDHPRRFEHTWFNIFSSLLEYSPSKHVAYCLPSYLFNKRPSLRLRLDVFTATSFRSWKNVNNGKNYAFLNTRKYVCSPHNNALRVCQDLLNQDRHIRNVFHVRSLDQIMNNRIHNKTLIDTICYLTLQACTFEGHNETNESRNQGNFLETLKLLAYTIKLQKLCCKMLHIIPSILHIK